MKRIPMTPIRSGPDEIEGGWEAAVPEMEPKEGDLAAYTSYFASDGYSPAQARALAIATLQAVFEGGFIRTLRQSIARWAQLYRRRYGSLEGFDPEIMQQAYMPRELTGRRGKRFINELFREMRDAKN